MVTDGTVLSDELIMSGEHEMLFLKTDNGAINTTVVKNCMITIKRYKYFISQFVLVPHLDRITMVDTPTALLCHNYLMDCTVYFKFNINYYRTNFKLNFSDI